MWRGILLTSPIASSHPVDEKSSLTPDRIVLIGFMASGKTEVGATLAERLGWRHIDLDREIEKRAGSSIAEIFADAGEAGFRALEVAVTPDALRDSKVVVSTGGGWVTNPGVFELLPADAATIHLRVSPAEVLNRIQWPGQPRRPLLEGGDPAARVSALLAIRAPLYGRADYTIDTDGLEPETVAGRILVLTGLETVADSPNESAKDGKTEG